MCACVRRGEASGFWNEGNGAGGSTDIRMYFRAQRYQVAQIGDKAGGGGVISFLLGYAAQAQTTAAVATLQAESGPAGAGERQE